MDSDWFHRKLLANTRWQRLWIQFTHWIWHERWKCNVLADPVQIEDNYEYPVRKVATIYYLCQIPIWYRKSYEIYKTANGSKKT